MNGKKSAFGKCQAIVAKKSPGVKGKLTLKVTVQPSGSAKASVVKNGTGQSALGSCCGGKVRQIKFPKPEGGAAEFQVTITFKAL